MSEKELGQVAKEVRSTWDYSPGQHPALKISRSRLQLFLDCPRCFWLVMRRRVKRPSIADYVLNITVDLLLKKEFDSFRRRRKPHPVMEENKITAVPFIHEDLDKWRNPFEGVQYWDEKLNLLVFGGIDDVWQDDDGRLIVVDYKATAKDKPLTELYPEGSYHDSYRRQMDVYSWLLFKNGFKMSSTAYFLYATADKGKPKFANRLNFQTNLIAYEVQTDWIEEALASAKACLDGDLPKYRKKACEWCDYVWNRLQAARK